VAVVNAKHTPRVLAGMEYHGITIILEALLDIGHFFNLAYRQGDKCRRDVRAARATRMLFSLHTAIYPLTNW